MLAGLDERFRPSCVDKNHARVSLLVLVSLFMFQIIYNIGGDTLDPVWRCIVQGSTDRNRSVPNRIE